MEIQTGAQVKTIDDKVLGKVDRVVIDPGSMAVTHLVVQKGLLLTSDKVLPMDWVTSSSGDEVILKQEVTELDNLPDFEENYVRQLGPGEPETDTVSTDYMARPYYWYPPLGASPVPYAGIYAGPPLRIEREQNIPGGTVALKEGAMVYDKDGDQVGNVERLYTDPDTGKSSHFVLSSGFLFKDRKLIPTQWVKWMEEDKIHLGVGSRFLEDLPPFTETT